MDIIQLLWTLWLYERFPSELPAITLVTIGMIGVYQKYELDVYLEIFEQFPVGKTLSNDVIKSDIFDSLEKITSIYFQNTKIIIIET